MPTQLDTRICRSCKLEKPLDLSNFHWRKDNQRFRMDCIPCFNLRAKKYREENPEVLKERKALYYEDNKEEINEKRKQDRAENRDGFRDKEIARYHKNKDHGREQKREWNKKNPEKVKAYKRRSYERNRDKLLAKSKKWAEENKEHRSQYFKDYKEKNKKHIRGLNREWDREKRKDPCHRLRLNVSRSINRALKGEKKGLSILDHLPYTIETLLKHIEDHFEPWMNHANYGQYDPKTWDDNDAKTWKWQLDHIIPHSTFHYENMDCEEFRKCWALKNLRPLNAKQNIIDGSTRVRHKSKPTKKTTAVKPKKA